MVVSVWFSDDELISQLRMFFDEKEASVIDFKGLLGQIHWIDGLVGEVKVKGRVFRFNVEVCDVVEVLV